MDSWRKSPGSSARSPHSLVVRRPKHGGPSSSYTLADLVLELRGEAPGREGLDQLLGALAWVKTDHPTGRPTLTLSVGRRNSALKIPPGGREAFHADGVSGLEIGDDFYLTDGASVFHLRPPRGEGRARMAPSFFEKPAFAQAHFWCFGLLKLLRPRGIYGLHAAAVATDGQGLLLVGPSGSGKSTLAIGLVRKGWKYLSDDAVLLRAGSQGVETLALRRSFYVEAGRATDYSPLPLGEEIVDVHGGRKRRLYIEEAHREQYVSQCIPRWVVFPRLHHQSRSALRPVGSVDALALMLAQSAPQLFDRRTMTRHLELLERLLRQCASFELQAGTDLYDDPAKLVTLLAQAQGEGNWRGLSSN